MTFNEESKCTLCVHFLTYISLLALCYARYSRGFPGGSVVKNPPANAGDAGSVPGSGRFLRRNLKKEEMATHSNTLAWKIPWTERSLVGSSPWGHKRVRHNPATTQHQRCGRWLLKSGASLSFLIGWHHFLDMKL